MFVKFLYESLWQIQALAFIFCYGQTTVNPLGLPMAVMQDRLFEMGDS
jgi:hypothetical protein